MNPLFLQLAPRRRVMRTCRSRDGIVSFGVIYLVAAAAVVSGQTYGVGRPLTPDEIRRHDSLIPPTGEGLPPGSGTAEKGKAIFAAQCARCHGATGREGPNDVLVGGTGSLATPKPRKTVGSYWPYATTVWDYVNRAMPFDRPGVLTADEVYSVVAYVLHLNGIVAATDVIDAKTLPKVRMPNREGFVPAAGAKSAKALDPGL